MKLFSIVSSADFPATKMHIKIVGSLNAFTDSDVSFEHYKSLKASFPALSAALKEAQLIVVATEPKLYNKTKKKLTAALSLTSVENETILAKLSDALSAEDRAENAAFPESATVFPTKDGVNSGFIIKKGHQEIMMLALDDTRLDVVLRTGVIPYLTSGEVMETPPAQAVHSEVPAAEEEKPEEQPKVAEIDTNSKSADVLIRTLNILRENGQRAAVTGNQNAEYIKELGKDMPAFDEFFTFTPHVNDRGDYNVTDYTAQMARSARELSGADFGVCISEICDTEECSYICVAVAGEASAIVRKLYKEDSETDDSFTRDAAEEVVELIGEKASGSRSVGIEIPHNAAEVPEKKKFASTKGGKALISIVVILLVAGLCVGAYFLAQHQKKLAAENTTVPPTTEAPQTTEAPAPVVTETVLLSEMMRYEALNGITPDHIPQTDETTTAGALNTEPTKATNPNKLPETITINGTEYPAKEAIARLMAAEISSESNAEALKAQAVVTYTYLKYRNTDFVINGVTVADDYSDNIYNAVDAVFGEYVSFENAPAFTPFTKMTAGKTAAADQIYGKSFQYLKPISSPSDKKQDDYKTEKVFTVEEMQNMITAYDESIALPENAGEWMKITKHDGAISTGVGYVETLEVGGKEMSGVDFVKDVLGGALPSHCFTVSYMESQKSFKLTSYGDGYGVGMSVLGANQMAAGGSDYKQILAKYYPGTKLA